MGNSARPLCIIIRTKPGIPSSGWWSHLSNTHSLPVYWLVNPIVWAIKYGVKQIKSDVTNGGNKYCRERKDGSNITYNSTAPGMAMASCRTKNPTTPKEQPIHRSNMFLLENPRTMKKKAILETLTNGTSVMKEKLRR